MATTPEHGEFVEQARKRVRQYAEKRRRAGYTDKIYAVVRSESGDLYDGVPFETSMSQCDFCAERHAINNMLFAETEETTFTALLVASPVPDESTDPPTPCGACRHALHEFSDDGAVYVASYVRKSDGWDMFPHLEQYSARGLYPNHQGHPSWE